MEQDAHHGLWKPRGRFVLSNLVRPQGYNNRHAGLFMSPVLRQPLATNLPALTTYFDSYCYAGCPIYRKKRIDLFSSSLS